MDAKQQVIFVEPGQGDFFRLKETRIEQLLPRQNSHRFSAYRVCMEPHQEKKPSYHKKGEELYYVVSGNGTARLGKEEYRLRAGCFFRVPPNTLHQFQTGEQPLEMLNFHSPPVFADQDTFFTSPSVQPVNPSAPAYPLEGFDYRLLDMGDYQKLEDFGSHRIIRPAPQAIWPKRLGDNEWKKAEAEYRYFKGKESGGKWTFHKKLPAEGWPIRFGELTLKINPTGFGHVGLFPEQALNWIWLRDQLKQCKNANILNIFGYTGAGTLAVASAGARVTHVDASRPSVAWARKNLELSGLKDRPVRWIVDDVLKFLKREHRRGTRYEGIIMDPPTFGRGTKKEVWKIEKDLPELMMLCREVLAPRPVLMLVTTHTPGFSALTLENMLLTYLVEPGSGSLESGEMYIHDTASGLGLPNGFYSRWVSHETGPRKK